MNPAVRIPAPLAGAARQLLETGTDRVPSVGGDVADPAGREKAYGATPLRPLLSLAESAAELGGDLVKVTCPVLIMTSLQDHVVDPGDSDILAAGVSGPVERVTLERSYHVATLDYDKDLVIEHAVRFAERVLNPTGAR